MIAAYPGTLGRPSARDGCPKPRERLAPEPGAFRFFARRTSGSWGVLNVVLRWTDSTGTSHDTSVASLQSGTSWTPSSPLQLATTLPLWQAGETLSAKLVFKPEQYGGSWAIDDVYIDPRMR